MFTIEDYKLLDTLVEKAMVRNDTEEFFKLTDLRTKISVELSKDEQQRDLLIDYIERTINTK